MGSKARADRIDADIHNLKIAAGEILGLKQTIEVQTTQIEALEKAVAEQQATILSQSSTYEHRIQDLLNIIKALEEHITKRLETTEAVVSGLQKVIPLNI